MVWIDGRPVRRNQYREAHDVHAHYAARLERVAALGIEALRFWQGWAISNPAPGVYDFAIDRRIVDHCRERGILPHLIGDIVHFGVPDWIEGHWQNPRAPRFMADYAIARARAFPEMRFFTPVNEPFMAEWCALLGWWNEGLTDMRAFVRGMKHQAQGTILSRAGIEAVWRAEDRSGQPVWFMNDAFQPRWRWEPVADDTRTLLQFCSLDLMLGHRDPRMRAFLLEHGMTGAEYEWFMEHGSPQRVVVGIDYYPMFDPAWGHRKIREFTRDNLLSIIERVHERYPQCPIMHMEVNALPADALAVWSGTVRAFLEAQGRGIPIVGLSWFGDEVQIGWGNRLLDDEVRQVGLWHYGEAQAIGRAVARTASYLRRRDDVGFMARPTLQPDLSEVDAMRVEETLAEPVRVN
ncbi:MAG: hypothetical protein U1E14_11430 [Geminicoccaceae bacterium]